MDVALQIRQHLPRDPEPTSAIVDNYCGYYQDLFQDVRNYECFKFLHLGLIAPIKRKSLPEIAKVVGITSAQSLHHFLANSPWSVEQLRERRLQKTKEALKGKAITVIIDETGDRKKGNRTDYVARQYLGSLGKIDQGIVSVNAYGVYQDITFPLKFKVFKPKGTLKPGDKYQTKIELAIELIQELIDFGFNIDLVLADSLYGESSNFINTLTHYQLSYVVAIRSNHSVLLPPGQRVRANKWCQFTRTFSDNSSETRYIREIVYGKRRKITYWDLTTDPETLPSNGTSFVMTNLQGKVKKKLGDLYGLRTWVEYGFRQCKQELGWKDYRFTKFSEIEKWWEIIYCVYLMVSLQTPGFSSFEQDEDSDDKTQPSTSNNSPQHPNWRKGNSWKDALHNLRLVMEPWFLFWLVVPWLEMFNNDHLLLGFQHLFSSVHQVKIGF
ncbi:IS701 family transposase [Euhalothece natronophila Z-M001]|uniref:IS701 family transposase n=1 Tax=Euhalothece natronophila Z-M001 TaxID=522448 RepID=A0A5B8NT84_9CHRO|nr:IS701 family transposase [Euhalothece natronophila]QDZ41428.1 IS701 family transposase [Euhalothece natronophila Z-M001]QDZ41499.1 IS701 family transposase [Euhalothece natronophila Z-M001]QDZ41511.1 IS701 family transposase [Euhalothece natronophila Z-M001]QDZ41532.1 IS701 family transposase [Euhalothece natronophila Z-M001]QDZ41545.1 IS701 family transposase [Euhalothece natronophila Z-M001]